MSCVHVVSNSRETDRDHASCVTVSPSQVLLP